MKLKTASTGFDALAKLAEVDVRMVVLNVYDLSRNSFVGAFNKAALVLMRGGIFHVAVEVWRREYSFGFSEWGTGVGRMTPRRDTSHTYRGSVQLGRTAFSKQECDRITARLAAQEEWQGTQYSTLAHNCTHFAHELVSDLGVAPVPDWVDRLGRVAEGCVAPFNAATLVDPWHR